MVTVISSDQKSASASTESGINQQHHTMYRFPTFTLVWMRNNRISKLQIRDHILFSDEHKNTPCTTVACDLFESFIHLPCKTGWITA